MVTDAPMMLYNVCLIQVLTGTSQTAAAEIFACHCLLFCHFCRRISNGSRNAHLCVADDQISGMFSTRSYFKYHSSQKRAGALYRLGIGNRTSYLQIVCGQITERENAGPNMDLGPFSETQLNPT
jgi:hypothetical protein